MATICNRDLSKLCALNGFCTMVLNISMRISKSSSTTACRRPLLNEACHSMQWRDLPRFAHESVFELCSRYIFFYATWRADMQDKADQRNKYSFRH